MVEEEDPKITATRKIVSYVPSLAANNGEGADCSHVEGEVRTWHARSIIRRACVRECGQH